MARAFSFSWRLGALAAAGVLAAAATAPAQDQLAVKGGRIVPIAGPALDGGVILIRDGRIQAVGKDLAIPADYKVIDAAGKVVLPGFIEAHSARGMDRGNERNDNVPFLSVVDAIDPGQEYFEDCRRNGVTTVAVVPGDETMIGGQAAIIKTAGTFVDQMLLKRHAGLKISLRPSTGRSRMSHLATLRREFDAARDFVQEERERTKVTAGASRPAPARPDGDGPMADEPVQQPPPVGDAPQATPEIQQADTNARREALARLLKGELTAFIYCDAALDVPQAVKLVQTYQLKAILVLGQNCYKAAPQVAASKLPVVLDPTLVFWETDPRTGEDRKIILPRIYREAGVPVTFQVTGAASASPFFSPNLPGTLGSNYLWYQAATAVKYGTPVAEALEAITLRPARILGVSELVGSIEPGKDADLVILTGDPLKLDTWVETTLVRGQVVYERDKDRKLQHLLQGPK
jgi:imidazolonepropionase-like amidohydrolase